VAAPVACIVCGSDSVEPFLDLGETALANKFLPAEELETAEPAYPLIVGFCSNCTHIQLTDHVSPPDMFEDYLYVSSASDTLKDHLWDLSDVVVERCGLGEGDLVIDIGANDGSLLKGFRRHGIQTLGVDPARNLAELYHDPEIARYTGFFDSRSAREILEEYGPASAITATNTFPHIPELGDFVRGIDIALAPGGSFVIECHYLMDIFEQLAFDTVYHEHVSYWALGPMVRLFEGHGMEVTHAERLSLHHGQLRVRVQRKGEGVVDPGVQRIIDAERAAGLDRLETWQDFARRTERLKEDLHRTLAELRGDGKQVVGYGAPAKGNTLLGFLGLGPENLDYIVDRSPLKQGLYTPGTHIPVVPTERLLEDQPEYVLLLAWNFAEEVMGQQSEYRGNGGRFILPVPEVKVV
jgi:C-methyltransferase C-terminal domain/Putative zinc binding domain/Methyltransferase domain